MTSDPADDRTREAVKQWEAFERWAQNISAAILKCRTSGHRFPDWDDQRRTKISRRPDRTYIIDAACTRKCGVTLTRYVDQDGYLVGRNRIQMDYSQAVTANRDPDKAYLMPKDARSGRGFTRAQRAYLRRELIDRLSEWITDA
jgi:hypothetical protein